MEQLRTAGRTGKNFRILSGNMLKLIAAASMLVDHIGLMFFPQLDLLRIIGRLAFPIYAFMIAQGCKYTRNKKTYFLQIFVLAVFCQIVNYIFAKSLYMCILVTFSISILVIYALDYLKCSVFAPERPVGRIILGAVLTGMAVAMAALLNRIFQIDYGFWGCMVPVFASLFQLRGSTVPDRWNRLDHTDLHVLMLGLGLVLLWISIGGLQLYALLALPLLWCYSGTRGKRRMKYFFYLFYPVHLAVLEGICLLVG